MHYVYSKHKPDIYNHTIMMLKRLLLFTVTCLLFVSCSDDPSTFTDEPPELPPVTSMDVNMSTLTGSTHAKSATTQSNDHYIQAVFRAGIIKKVIDTNLLTPKNLLMAAGDTVAQLNDKQQWEWNYSYTANTGDFAVRLVAERVASSIVNWSFFVTADHLELENHLLFGGTTKNGGQQGTWTHNSLQDPENAQQLSEINWSIPEEEQVELRLDIFSDRSVAAGSYIDYSVDGADKSVEYYDAGEDTITIIAWNADTKAGSVIAPDINSGEKACWDEQQENVSCSE